MSKKCCKSKCCKKYKKRDKTNGKKYCKKCPKVCVSCSGGASNTQPKQVAGVRWGHIIKDPKDKKAAS
ncbi:MAG: hypothetical protein ACI9RM_002454 [Ulvibacter sp.]|jgi:hypothetical protein